MDNVLKLDLTPQMAKRIIAEVLASKDRVVIVPHCIKRMRERGVDQFDIERCLTRGSFTEEPYRGVKGNWQFTMNSLVGGEPLTVAAALDYDQNGNYIVVITAYRG